MRLNEDRKCLEPFQEALEDELGDTGKADLAIALCQHHLQSIFLLSYRK